MKGALLLVAWDPSQLLAVPKLLIPFEVHCVWYIEYAYNTSDYSYLKNINVVQNFIIVNNFTFLEIFQKKKINA